MMDFVKTAFEDADVLVYMVEVGEKELKDEKFFKKLEHSTIPVLILMKKIERTDQENVEQIVEYLSEKLPNAEIYPLSALNNFNVKEVFNRIVELLPQSPPYYPKDALTDKPARFFVNEIIREKILLNYQKEIPSSVEIETEEFIEDEDIIRIKAGIMVERYSQQGNMIRHTGSSLQTVGIQAREEMEKFFGKQGHIELIVKVNKDWGNHAYQLRRFAYNHN